ncbi:unnamed protein product [Alternaria alternata]|jgi:hypothetical protein|nr:uncharacterized protein J4E82_000106 [Alternaria postmessia]KAB2104631.1 hypothetical protein AG0111_0g6860 [Alternaria gaisen]RYN48400.1 hypothetical protein AA0114_g7104 [Alternaria tenuissima]RYN77986.1 hypothetical protein AA0117_g4699 [Alternaria alternata]KAI5380908.1 hypothetical protein J4E82_000106 [Alternaria postmessia]RYN58656.1 hypothetical protein AA0118_g7134 [Alternaria tenuissima]
MAGFTHFLKTILVPLFLAAILYVLLAFIILPFVRRHRSRYSQYLPMPATVTDFPTSWRTNLSDALYNLFAPSTWVRQRGLVDGSGQHDDDLFDDEEGEGMVGFDPIDERRREALEQRRSIMEEERRLGRELEEGFKDDSEDEHEDERRRSLSRHR